MKCGFTEEESVQRFLEESGGKFIRSKVIRTADYPRTTWLAWDGMRYVPDWKGEIVRKSIIESLEKTAALASAHSKRRFARRCRSSSGIQACLRRAGELLWVDPAQLDSNPDKINFRNGIIDMIEQRFCPHSIDDPKWRPPHSLNVAGADFDRTAVCPSWQRFLKRHMYCYDQELNQRLAGLLLSGKPSLSSLVLMHGPTAVTRFFLHTISEALGDYSLEQSYASIRNSNRDTLSRNRRLLYGIEPDSASALFTRGILEKHLKINAQFHLWLACKSRIYAAFAHLPRIRFRPQSAPLPSAFVIRQELPGILNWMILGYEMNRDSVHGDISLLDSSAKHLLETSLRC